MGVSGSGKSSIGKALSNKLGLPFIEGDDFHPAENIAKMISGISLEDADRWDWLESLNIEMRKCKNGAVLSCSALKESYRKIIFQNIENNQIVFLDGDFDLILERMKKRSNHFMPSKLLESQFEALEKPSNAYKVAINQSIEKILAQILNYINKANENK